MVRSTLRSQHITQNVTSHNGDFQHLLTFLVFAMFCLSDLALELNPGSQYYEDSDAEVMVRFGSMGAEKWQREIGSWLTWGVVIYREIDNHGKAPCCI